MMRHIHHRDTAGSTRVIPPQYNRSNAFYDARLALLLHSSHYAYEYGVRLQLRFFRDISQSRRWITPTFGLPMSILCRC